MNATQATTMKTIATIRTEEGVPTLKLRLRPEPSLKDICYERIKDSFYHGVYGDTSSPDTCFKLIIDKNTGYFNATKMCQLGGKQFRNWLQNKTVKELIDWLKEESCRWNSSGNSGPVYEVREGSNNDELNKQITGTYVCKELILSLASWISPSFYLRCSRIVNDYFIPKNEDLVEDKDELQEVLKQLDAKTKECEIKDDVIKEKESRIDSLEEMLLRAERERAEDRKKAEEQHRLLLKVGIRMEDLMDKNEDLTEKMDDLKDDNRLLQKRLNIAVVDRAPQPEDKTQRERFILLKSEEMDMPYHVIRAQEAGAKKTLKRYQASFTDVVVLVDLLCHPNSKTYDEQASPARPGAKRRPTTGSKRS